MNALQEQSMIVGSPFIVVEGESVTNTITYWDTVTLDANSYMYAYRGSQDKSSTVLSGSVSVLANVLTCKVIGAEVGGYTYRYFVKAIVGGNSVIRWFDRQVLKKSGPKTSFK